VELDIINLKAQKLAEFNQTKTLTRITPDEGKNYVDLSRLIYSTFTNGSEIVFEPFTINDGTKKPTLRFHRMGKKMCGPDGTRTRDPRRDRPVF
jgi:hypothetical protein